jgi:serine/threonine protein kinase
MIGKSLIHYEITAEIGKGGMGEVYQAKDTKLGRDVAIKVLPEEFAMDHDRVARFQREAKLLASLNHPNIAAIYGLEESDGVHFLVMELIEGDTLRDRIKTGPIPVEEALKLALQMAEALEAAHEKGVIHRDLKPANIKVTPEGKVKILDFGLAKAYVGDQGNVSPMDSPTISAAATQQGVILGTAAYMSPEQARGKPVDKRADIWAFGAVLFEMLTGRQAFQGEDVSETLASVIKGDSNLVLLPANIHPRVREVITRSLQKEQKKRYGGIGEAQYEIEQVLADPSGVFTQPISIVEPRRNLGSILALIATTIILTAIIVGTIIWYLRTPEPPQVTRSYYELPEGQNFNQPDYQTVAVSSDGRQFVYSTEGGLYLRSLEELESRLIIGTANDDPSEPLFSSDGKWLIYYSMAERKIKKIPIGGGVSITICDAPIFGGMNWGPDNTIIYGGAEENSTAQDCIMQVSSTGGTPNVLFKEEALAIGRPQVLPGGNSILFTKLDYQHGTLISRIMARTLENGETKEITTGFIGRYLPTGHLVYTGGEIAVELAGNLFAVPFDPDSLEITGEAVLTGEDIAGFLGVRYDISPSGTLVYMPGTLGTLDLYGFTEGTLMWVDSQGNEEALVLEPNIYAFPKISPNGTKVVFTTTLNTNEDIWIYDLAHETKMRLTFEDGEDSWPIWTPDSKQIVYRSSSDGMTYDINMKSADGFGEVEKIISWPNTPGPFSWSKDGKTLLSWDLTLSPRQTGISILSLEDSHERVPLLDRESNEDHPQISPDGSWLAYASNVSGQNEVYVCPFPEVNKGRWQVSTNGGVGPLWSPNGQELFYRNEGSVMGVSVETDTVFKYGKPRTLFHGNYLAVAVVGAILPMWDIHPDGNRFLMIKPSTSLDKESATAILRKIIIVQNWFEELKERVPVD